jgi:hypothetical protein
MKFLLHTSVCETWERDLWSRMMRFRAGRWTPWIPAHGGGTRAFVFSDGFHPRQRPPGGTSQGAGCPGQPLSVGHSKGARKPFLQAVDA